MREIWLLLDTSGMGGIESHVAELAIGLAEAGERPRVLFLADRGPHPLRVRLTHAGVAWEALPGGMCPLVRRLRLGRPRVLHTHGYKANLLGRIAARLAGIPAVATYHAGERPNGMVAVYDCADRWTSALGGRIVVSRPILARMPFGGVFVPNFVRVPPAPCGQRPGTVAFVGRMAQEKGPDLFCRMAETLLGVRCLAFGDGPMRASLERRFGETVEFKGAVAGMDEAWKDVGLLAITSRAEGLPLAALEAMAHGVPVASFAVGGLPDLIDDGENGFLAAPGDVAAIASVVRRWAGLPPDARAAFGQRARSSIRARYGSAAGVAAIRAIYPEARTEP